MIHEPGHAIETKSSAAAGRFCAWLCAVVLLGLSAQPARAQYDPDWARHFRVGALVGFNIKADFKMTGNFLNPNDNLAKGIYDDGYVRTDSTGNDGGLTTFWGYNSASQYHGGANPTLTMNSTTSYSTTGNGVHEESGTFPGLDMAYGGNLWYWKDLRFGWDFGFGLLPISLTDKTTMGAQVVQSTYTFDASGIDKFPAPGYQGGFNGPGALLGANPIPPVTSQTNTGTIGGSRTLDVMLYTLRFGPSVHWDINNSVALSASLGPAAGFVSGNYRFNDVIQSGGGTTQNKGKIGMNEFVYGGYVNGTLMYHVEKNGDFYISAQFMPLSSASVSSGGRAAKLKLDGSVYISAGVNWPF